MPACSMSSAPNWSMQHERSQDAVFDTVALERLFHRHEGQLFNVVCRWTWDREDAADIVQEAFGRLWDIRKRVEPAGAKALVYRIALNLAASRRRWRRVRTFVGLESASSDGTAEDSMLAAERRDALGRALDQLPDKLRRAVVLCELSELTYTEIAAIEGTRPGTVGSRRSAGLARLRPLLARLGSEAEEKQGGQ